MIIITYIFKVVFIMAIRGLMKITEQEKEKIVEIIKELLLKHEEIIFPLLYGSFIEDY